MAAVSVHLQKIKEHCEEIEDAIKLGVENRAATIAFHTSACSVDLLEAYLHKAGKIPIGAQIKHDWFKKPLPTQKILPLADRKLSVDFPGKEEIFAQLYEIEVRRNKLIYGKPAEADVDVLLTAFNKVKAMLLLALAKEGVDVA